MHDLPTEWTALCALVFLLGLKHGFDADHLATIDGLTRFNARHQRPVRPLLRSALFAGARDRGGGHRDRGGPDQREVGRAGLARAERRLGVDRVPDGAGRRQSRGGPRCRTRRGRGTGRLEGPAARRPQRRAPAVDRRARRRAVRALVRHRQPGRALRADGHTVRRSLARHLPRPALRARHARDGRCQRPVDFATDRPGRPTRRASRRG